MPKIRKEQKLNRDIVTSARYHYYLTVGNKCIYTLNIMMHAQPDVYIYNNSSKIQKKTPRCPQAVTPRCHADSYLYSVSQGKSYIYIREGISYNSLVECLRVIPI